MSASARRPAGETVADLPAEDIALLMAGTSWRVPWELMMLGPFVSCGLLDGDAVRHVTVPAMVASAVRGGSGPDAALEPCDYPKLPVLAPDLRLLDAAVLVVETGWDLAVVKARGPRLVSARSVYRALVGSDVVTAGAAFGDPNVLPVSARGASASRLGTS